MKLTIKELKEMVRQVVKDAADSPMISQMDLLKKSLKADMSDFKLELKNLFDLEDELSQDGVYDILQGVLADIKHSADEMYVKSQKINKMRDAGKYLEEEGTGGMSSASSGGPIINEENNSDEYHTGYGEALEKVAEQLEKLALENSQNPIATTLKTLSNQLKGFAAKSKAKGFKLKNIREMFSPTLEPKYKVLDGVENSISKHKLLYEWVRSGKVSFKEYLELSNYINKDPAQL